MARPSIVELIAALTVEFPDNNAGLITPQKVRDYFTDLLDAIAPSYGILQTPTLLVQVFGTSNSAVVFGTNSTSGAPDFTANAGTGTIARADQGVTLSFLSAQLEGTANRVVTFEVFANGNPTGWVGSATLQGAGKPVSINMNTIHGMFVPTTFQLMGRADTAGTSVNILSASWVARSNIVYQY